MRNLRGLQLQLLVVLMLLCGTFFSGCSSCHKQTAIVKTSASIEIKDPWFQKIISATKTVSIKGTGGLKAGRYKFKNQTIDIAPDTNFDLDMSIAFDGKPVVSLASANGWLTVNNAIKFDNIPLPTRIELKNGEATIEMDIARELFAVIINALQHRGQAASASSDLSGLPTNIHVKEAKLDLNPGAKLEIAGSTAVFGEASYLRLENVDFTSVNDYKGALIVNLNLDKDSKYQDAAIACSITSGKVQYKADISCQEGTIDIKTNSAGKDCVVAVSGCEAKSTGINKQTASAKEISVAIQILEIEKKLNSAEEPSLSVTGAGLLKDAKFEIVNPPHAIVGNVPNESSVTLTFSRAAGKTNADLTIDKSVTTKDFRWTAKLDDNDIDVQLREASITHASAGTGTGIKLNLDAAAIKPARLAWKSPEASLDVAMDPAARVSSSGPLTFSFQNGHVNTPSSIPLKLAAGKISIKDKNKNVYKLKQVSGDCKINVGEKGIKVDSDLSMKLSSRMDLLGIPGFNASVGKLKISATEKHAQLQLIDGLLLLSQKELKDTIREKIPDPYVVNVNETLLEKKQWRYKNFCIKKVTVTKPTVNQLDFQKTNEVALDADADLAIEGTVEVYHQKLNPLSKEKSAWKQHPWTANAHVRESGVVDYKLVSGKSLKDSKIHLESKIQVGYPEKIEVDWSKVVGDTLAKAENKVLQTAIAGAKTFAKDKTVAVNYSRDIAVFKTQDPRLKSIQVKSLTISPRGEDLAICFSGAASF